MDRKFTRTLAGAAGFLVMTAGVMAQPPSLSSRYDFMKLEYPGSLFSYPLGINDQREAVGVYVDAQFVQHGFLWKNGKFTKIDFPGAPQFPGGGTGTGGINNRGDIVDVYNGKGTYQHGFLLARPTWCEEEDEDACKPIFTSIDDPAAAQTHGIPFELGPGLGTASIGINDRGMIVGLYATPGLYSDGFVLSRGKFTPVDSPLASHNPGMGTKLFAINLEGTVAGDYLTQDNPMALPISHGFLWEDGKYTSIEVPGSIAAGFGTQVNGVNAFRIAVGIFSLGGTGHGLVWAFGNYFSLDFPGQPFSECHSINNRGDITGAYASDPLTLQLRGFLAFPKDR